MPNEGANCFETEVVPLLHQESPEDSFLEGISSASNTPAFITHTSFADSALSLDRYFHFHRGLFLDVCLEDGQAKKGNTWNGTRVFWFCLVVESPWIGLTSFVDPWWEWDSRNSDKVWDLSLWSYAGSDEKSSDNIDVSILAVCRFTGTSGKSSKMSLLEFLKPFPHKHIKQKSVG